MEQLSGVGKRECASGDDTLLSISHRMKSDHSAHEGHKHATSDIISLFSRFLCFCIYPLQHPQATGALPLWRKLKRGINDQFKEGKSQIKLHANPSRTHLKGDAILWEEGWGASLGNPTTAYS